MGRVMIERPDIEAIRRAWIRTAWLDEDVLTVHVGMGQLLEWCIALELELKQARCEHDFRWVGDVLTCYDCGFVERTEQCGTH